MVGYMRTPKVEALNRTINWLNNNYICDNKYSEVLSTKKILFYIKFTKLKLKA